MATLIETITKHFKEMVAQYPEGLSSTSTKKFDVIRNDLANSFGLSFDDVYAVGAKDRPGNLEVRLCQGERATMHTMLGVGFMYDKENTEENRKKLTQSAFVTLTKMLNRGKASYEMVLLMIQNASNDVFATGLIYGKDTLLTEKIQRTFNIDDELMHKVESTIDITSSGLENAGISPIIYYGAPGTGKTRYVQKEIAAKYPDDCSVFTTFHQSYSYEDFVEGLKPMLDDGDKEIRYHIEPGVFYNACERAAKIAGYDNLKECLADSKEGRTDKFGAAIEGNKIVLLCIDEINRGNVASIFGDLISLIEPSKRLGAGEYEMMVTLPYSKTLFGVPANLLIVGTMNTADRSIQLLDSALRRRFRFYEFVPDYSVFKEVDGTASKILKNINARIRSVLNKDNQIGHSYLMNATTNKEIIDAIVNKIIPLLEEYFYNDVRKVRFVLNEDEKTKCPFYKEDKEAKEAYQAYLSTEDIDDEEKSFYYVDGSIAQIDDEDECGKYLKHLLGENEE